MALPIKFLERLKSIVPSSEYESVVASFDYAKPIVCRVNTLKGYTQCPGELVSWYADARILSSGCDIAALCDTGLVYRQALSSMIPPLILSPSQHDRILDMCAAPGSKTSQLAQLMDNTGELIALEIVRARYFKLRSVLTLLGVDNCKTICCDARRYRNDGDLFDGVLLDAPCSSEGRFSVKRKKTYAYWSERKIKEMQRKQRGLLLHASRQVKIGGHIVYSTCTFAPEENEAVIDWFLRKTNGAFSLMPIDIKDVPQYPALNSWKNKEFVNNVSHCMRILPNEVMDSFFIGLLKREV